MAVDVRLLAVDVRLLAVDVRLLAIDVRPLAARVRRFGVDVTLVPVAPHFPLCGGGFFGFHQTLCRH